MPRSPSLLLIFSSLCALAACACSPTARAPRPQPQRVVAPEPMGNPAATEPAPPSPSLELMEPDFAAAPDEPLGVAAIQNLEDPSQPLAAEPAPEPAEPAAPAVEPAQPAAKAEKPAEYDPLLDFARSR